jgi:YD repeat-containing protein
MSKRDRMRAVISGRCSRLFLVLAVMLVGHAGYGQIKDIGDAGPRRGIAPSGFYSVNQLETINPVSGGVFLNIPITSMPRNQGGGPQFNLNLIYNSAHWDAQIGFVGDGSFYYFLSNSPSGGWRYNLTYSLEMEWKDNYLGDSCSAENGSPWQVYKLTLVLPDGSRHLLRKQNSESNHEDAVHGYYKHDPGGHSECSRAEPSPSTEPTPQNEPLFHETQPIVNYHTVDGSDLDVAVINGASCPSYPEDGSSAGIAAWLTCIENLSWKLYYPDGTMWHQSGFGPTSGFMTAQDCSSTVVPPKNCPAGGSMVDRAQNYYSTFFVYVNNAWTTAIMDQGSRSITIQSTPGSGDVITTQGIGGETLQWTVHWRLAQGLDSNNNLYYINYWSSPELYLFSINPRDWVVDSIDLPTQYCGAGSPSCGLEYVFSYDTDNGGHGINHLKSFTTPFGATSTYSYVTDEAYNPNDPNYTWFMEPLVLGRITQKTLHYASSYGAPDEVTSYSYAPACTSYLNPSDCTSIVGPDGGTTTSWYYSLPPATAGPLSDSRSGLVWKIQRPNGEITERYWGFKDPTGDPTSSTAGNGVYQNPYIKTEYVTLNGKTKAKDYEYDANGNVVSLSEYDWADSVTIPRDNAGAPSGLASNFTNSIRTTLAGFVYGDGTSSSCSGTAHPYWSSPFQAFRSAVCSQEVHSFSGSGPLVSRKELSYAAVNSHPESLELTQQRNWSSAKASLGSCSLYAQCLNSSNAAVTDFGHDAYGNVTSVTEPGRSSGTPLRSQTTYQYDQSGIFLLSVTHATGTLLERSIQYVSDPYTGLVQSVTDYNGVVMSTGYDAVGRPTLVREASGSGVERQTAMVYALGDRCVITQKDLASAGDKALETLQHYDGLGRLWLNQQIEDGSSPNCSDTTSGIKTEMRYSNSSAGRFQLVSNPYRSSSDPTAGWTLTAFDAIGRTTLVGYFTGGTAPAWGNLNADNGKTTMTYDLVDSGSLGIYDTVSDQASLRWNFRDGLGRLIEVREKDPGNAFTYTTTYGYDALDNLTGVTQPNTLSRVFSYDSLGRLSSATNPESGASTYYYDDNGNLTQRILGAGTGGAATMTSLYDALNRVYLKSYSGIATPSVTYCYDGKTYGGADGSCANGSTSNGIGQLTQVQNAVSTTSYTGFDALGRVGSSTQTTGGISYPFSYSSLPIASESSGKSIHRERWLVTNTIQLGG